MEMEQSVLGVVADLAEEFAQLPLATVVRVVTQRAERVLDHSDLATAARSELGALVGPGGRLRPRHA